MNGLSSRQANVHKKQGEELLLVQKKSSTTHKNKQDKDAVPTKKQLAQLCGNASTQKIDPFIGISNQPRPTVLFSYCQKNCPTLSSFTKANSPIVGYSAVKKLYEKTTPSADDVRTPSKPYPDILKPNATRGLHEIVPTSQRNIIASIKDDNLRRTASDVQSGARFSTALTLFTQCDPKYKGDPNKQITAHTGTFDPPTAHTKGQAAAHNKLRAALDEGIAANLTGDNMTIHMINAQLAIMPHGKQIIEDPGLTNNLPVLSYIGKIDKPLTSVDPSTPVSAGDIETSRSKFAIDNHKRREELKDRNRALKRQVTSSPNSHERTRSPSPPRTPLKLHSKNQFSGGVPREDYVRNLPSVPLVAKDHPIAHMAAWVTTSMRF